MSNLTVALCGTVMIDGRISVEELKNLLSPNIKRVLGSADLSICDFETVLSSRAASEQKAVSLIVDPNYASVIHDWGFTHANCVHNHSLDGGIEGFNDTISYLRTVGVVPVVGQSAAMGTAHVVETIRGRRVALLAYSAIGEIAVGNHPWERALEDIASYRRVCDHVLVFYHDGYDLAPIPLPSDQEKYRRLAGMGADAVIINQAHVFQGYEVFKGVPIVFSTGNLAVHTLDDLRWAPIDRGQIIVLTLEGQIRISLHPTQIQTRTLSVDLAGTSGDETLARLRELTEWYAGNNTDWWSEFSARGVIAGPFLAQQVFSGLPQWWKKYGLWGLLKVMRVYLNRFHRQLVVAWCAGLCGIRSKRYDRFYSKN